MNIVKIVKERIRNQKGISKDNKKWKQKLKEGRNKNI